MEFLSYGFLGIFGLSCVMYLVPFVFPAPIFLAGAIAAIYPDYSPFSIGVAVSAGSSVAKLVLYYTCYLSGRALGVESTERLRRYAIRVGRWKFIAAFVSSAAPIPDEPVLISLALIKYNPPRFFLAFFLGKLVTIIPGAYLGKVAGITLSGLVGNLAGAIISVIFTLVITVVLMKVDLEQLWMKFMQKSAHS